MTADRFRSQQDRLFGISGRGQTAVSQLGSFRAQTAGGVAGARGQNVADQFAASLIPVAEKTQYLSGLMNMGATVMGARSAG